MGPEFFGEMHCSNANITVTITAVNTWTTITGGLASNHIESYSFNGSNALVSHVKGTFAIFLSIALQCAVLSEISATFALNGTPSPNQMQNQLAKGGVPSCCSVGDIIDVNPGDTVTVVVQNNSGVTNLVVNALSLVALRIA